MIGAISVLPSKTVLFGYKKVIRLVFEEAIGLSDVGIVSRSISRVFTESLSLSETMSKTTHRTFTETVALEELYGKTVSKTFTETLALEDLGLTRRYTKRVSEDIGLSEATAKTVRRTITEDIGLTDVAYKTARKFFEDVLGLGEVFGRRLSLTFHETIGLYEYWGYVYPYIDPDPFDPIRSLVRVVDVLDRMGIDVRYLLDDPYILYLLRRMVRRMLGEL
jgi:hypothetical protein